MTTERQIKDRRVSPAIGDFALQERTELLARIEEQAREIERIKTIADNYSALNMDAQAELSAHKAGQGEAVTEVSAETFSSDGTSDIITCNLPIGTKLYACPPSDPGTVPVRRGLLELAAENLESAICSACSEPCCMPTVLGAAQELRALLASHEHQEN